jgi:hypothetical protein
MPSPTPCTSPATILDGAPPCPNPATVRCWSDAPGWETPSPECEYHARVFERMIERHYPGRNVFSEPMPSSP